MLNPQDKEMLWILGILFAAAILVAVWGVAVY